MPCPGKLGREKMAYEIRHFVETKFLLRKDTHYLFIISMPKQKLPPPPEIVQTKISTSIFIQQSIENSVFSFKYFRFIPTGLSALRNPAFRPVTRLWDEPKRVTDQSLWNETKVDRSSKPLRVMFEKYTKYFDAECFYWTMSNRRRCKENSFKISTQNIMLHTNACRLVK